MTTDFRADWLRSRRWLARREVRVAPVFSTLPAPSPAAAPPEPSSVGLFGYGYEGARASLVLEALALLRGRGIEPCLWLLGAPGRESAAGERWCAQARSLGLQGAIRFSGVLPAQELSDALARCEVLLCVAALGPTSKKTTLAASLASGRPVVALDGPFSWPELIAQQAARVVSADATELAGALEQLLCDRPLRERLGARGRAFYERQMAPSVSAEVMLELLKRLA